MIINEELEELLSSYMQGDIDIHAFRQGRHTLIESFANSDITEPEQRPDVETTQSIKPLHLENNPEADDLSKVFNVPVINKQDSNKISKNIIILAIGGVVLLGTAFTLWQNSTDTPTPVEKFKVAPKNAEPKVIATEPFINEFLIQNDWSSESLSDFLVTWQDMSMEEQALARQSEGFKKVEEGLKTHYQSLQNLKNSKDKSRQENLLSWFSHQMSISLD
ncbi:MAG: hypothetical protein R3240_02755 [Gammaproteobacteria bacterium]|nr:hypothetical protein [Gammaproteobacteria bacterium]